jgi:hypothetical protein
MGRKLSKPMLMEAPDLRHGQALRTCLVQPVLQFVQLERLDDGFDLLHGIDLSSYAVVRGLAADDMR